MFQGRDDEEFGWRRYHSYGICGMRRLSLVDGTADRIFTIICIRRSCGT